MRRAVLTACLLLAFPATAFATEPSLVLLGPADGATVYVQYAADDPVEMTWQAAPATNPQLDHYRLFLDGAPYDIDPTTPTSFNHEPSLYKAVPTTAGEHEWRVEAHYADDSVRTSPTRHFTVIEDHTPPEPFSLAAPAHGALSQAPPTLSWTPATDTGSGMAGQLLVIDYGGGRWDLDPQATTFTPSLPVCGCDYEWYVIATDKVGNQRISERRMFAVDPHPPSVDLTASTDRALTGVMITFTASAFDGLAIAGREWDFDGDGTYETPGDRIESRVFDTPGIKTVGVRVSDTAGNSSKASMKVQIEPAPTFGVIGVSINDGARFTNSPNVTLHLRWAPFTRSLILANDGGFFGATEMPVAQMIPWTLDSSGAERLPKTVYVRFSSGSEATYSDDIILDETAPLINTASATRVSRAYKVKLRADDTTSGIATVQVARDRKRPGAERRWSRTLRVAGRTAPRWIRATDHAGNRSGWRRIVRAR